jgi:hypothetical protein
MLSIDLPYYYPDGPLFNFSANVPANGITQDDHIISALSLFPNLHRLNIHVLTLNNRTPPLGSCTPSMFEKFRASKTRCPLKRATITQVVSAECYTVGVNRFLVCDAYGTGTHVHIKGCI